MHKRTRNLGRKGYSRLQAQITDAANSVGETIAEGCGAATKPEFARFLDMWIKSLNETQGHRLTARELDVFSIEEWQKLHD